MDSIFSSQATLRRGDGWRRLGDYAIREMHFCI